MGQDRQPLPGEPASRLKQTAPTNPQLTFYAASGLVRLRDGAAFEISGGTLDITERKVAEARSNAVVEAATDAIVAVDKLAFVRALNPAAAEMFGYAPDEVIGRHVNTLITLIGTGGEVEGRRKDGSTFPIDLGVKELRVDDACIFIGMLRDVAARTPVEERQRLLIAELNHRMRNILAKLSIMIELSRASADSVDALADALSGRINALARTSARFSGGGRIGRLRELIEDELAPYRSETNLCVEGPDLALDREPAQALALVLHELVTNAVKYGALSTANGCVVVRWQVAGETSQLSLVWQETGGPTVVAPERRGFGSRLIDSVVHHELGAEPAANGPPLRDASSAGARGRQR
jgi:two-component sensor histidine kinase